MDAIVPGPFAQQIRCATALLHGLVTTATHLLAAGRVAGHPDERGVCAGCTGRSVPDSGGGPHRRRWLRAWRGHRIGLPCPPVLTFAGIAGLVLVAHAVTLAATIHIRPHQQRYQQQADQARDHAALLHARARRTSGVTDAMATRAPRRHGSGSTRGIMVAAISAWTCMGPLDRPLPAPFPAATVAPDAARVDEVRIDDAQRYAQARMLRSRLLAGASATGTLEAWCQEHHRAQPAAVHAVPVSMQHNPPLAVRQWLAIDATVPLRYRRVRLVCGARVLSEADNWYLPDALTEQMNALLDSSEEPFGRVVAPLQFQRQTLSDALYWPPRGAAHGGTFLQIHALLRDARQRAFSYVVERYLAQALA